VKSTEGFQSSKLASKDGGGFGVEKGREETEKRERRSQKKEEERLLKLRAKKVQKRRRE